MSVGLIVRSAFFGFSVTTLSNKSPRSERYEIDASSPIIRIGDPVKEIAGGIITRCSAADSALLGFAAENQNTGLPTSIPVAPRPTGPTGNPTILVYVADTDNYFLGDCNGVPTQALRTTVHDLIMAGQAPQPTSVTPVGTTGATAYAYTITSVTVNGESVVGTARSTATGNAVLSATNYNAIVIPYVNQWVTSFNVYRAGLLVGSIAADVVGLASVTFNDVGAAAGVAAPTVDYSGWLINEAATSTGVVKIDALDDRPALPGRSNRKVQFRVPAAKSQFLGVTGS